MTEFILNKSAKLNFEVKTYDIDIVGHVNNIAYVRWIEDLRIKLFDKLCNLSRIFAQKYYPVVISTNIEYKNQIKLFDKPLGIIEISDYKYGIFTLDIKILLKNKIFATAQQRCIIFDLMNCKMIRDKKVNQLIEPKNKISSKNNIIIQYLHI